MSFHVSSRSRAWRDTQRLRLADALYSALPPVVVQLHKVVARRRSVVHLAPQLVVLRAELLDDLSDLVR